MPKQHPKSTTKSPGVPGLPFTNPQTTPARGARRNWQQPEPGRDVIPRRTINGAGRNNMFLNGGLDG